MIQQAIHNKKALMQILHTNKEQIRSFGVKNLNLFGSFTKDQLVTDESDIDLLVEFEEGQKCFDNFIDLNYFLEELTGRKVELVTHQSLSKFIGPHILKQLEHVSL
jgi:predicted nucleotidyltransferase